MVNSKVLVHVHILMEINMSVISFVSLVMLLKFRNPYLTQLIYLKASGKEESDMGRENFCVKEVVNM